MDSLVESSKYFLKGEFVKAIKLYNEKIETKPDPISFWYIIEIFFFFQPLCHI